jgi:hypothetical protein
MRQAFAHEPYLSESTGLRDQLQAKIGNEEESGDERGLAALHSMRETSLQKPQCRSRSRQHILRQRQERAEGQGHGPPQLPCSRLPGEEEPPLRIHLSLW